MGWWNKAKDAVKKAGKDISNASKKAQKDVKAEADRLAANAKKEADKLYPYLLKHKPVSPHFITKAQLDSLKKKKKRYIKLSTAQVLSKDNTYFSLNHCDGLLFDCLAAIGGAKVNIEQYNDASFRWYRATPNFDCLPHSGSTISNDMLTGLTLWCAWFKKRDLFNATIHKLQKSKWVAGDSTTLKDKLGETIVKPQMITMMSHVNEYLSLGKLGLHNSPHCFSDTDKTYVMHLQALDILIYTITNGKISTKMLEVINRLVRKEPSNVLHQYNYAKYVTGNFEPVLSLLNNGQYWPERRLPTNHDRGTKWLPERGEKDYIADNERTKEVKYSGMDFCFIVSLLERDFDV